MLSPPLTTADKVPLSKAFSVMLCGHQCEWGWCCKGQRRRITKIFSDDLLKNLNAGLDNAKIVQDAIYMYSIVDKHVTWDVGSLLMIQQCHQVYLCVLLGLRCNPDTTPSCCHGNFIILFLLTVAIRDIRASKKKIERKREWGEDKSGCDREMCVWAKDIKCVHAVQSHTLLSCRKTASASANCTEIVSHTVYDDLRLHAQLSPNLDTLSLHCVWNKMAPLLGVMVQFPLSQRDFWRDS